jgi:hypothetical protein
MATQVNATRTSTAARKTVVLCIAALAAILMTLQLGGQVSTIQSPQTVPAPERTTDVDQLPGRPF